MSPVFKCFSYLSPAFLFPLHPAQALFQPRCENVFTSRQPEVKSSLDKPDIQAYSVSGGLYTSELLKRWMWIPDQTQANIFQDSSFSQHCVLLPDIWDCCIFRPSNLLCHQDGERIMDTSLCFYDYEVLLNYLWLSSLCRELDGIWRELIQTESEWGN